jgi:hypothetical protein
VKAPLRASAVGLVAGLMLAALVLGGFAVVRMQTGCTNLSPEECNLERQIAISLARQQALGAVGLILISAGLALALRRR